MSEASNYYNDLNRVKSFEKTIVLSSVGNDTIKLIVDTINTYYNSDYVNTVTKILSKGNPTELEFLKRLFFVSCKNVKYTADPAGHEIIFTPKLLMKLGKGDCKKFTVFIGSVLKNKNIDFIVRVVKYEPFVDWQHVYIIVPDVHTLTGQEYITLDPVNKEQFNKEVNFYLCRDNFLNGSISKEKNMNKLSVMGNINGANTELDFISGLGEAADQIEGDLDDISGRMRSKHCRRTLAGLGEDYINGVGSDDDNMSGLAADEMIDGLGKRKKANPAQKAAKKEKRKQLRKKLFKGAKAVAFAPNRAAFLGLIALAGALSHTPLKINLAKKIAEAWKLDGGKKITKFWEFFGGTRDGIKKALSKAAKTQLQGEESFVKNGQIYGTSMGVVTATAAAAAIAAATPLVIAVMKILKKDKVVSNKEADIVEGTSRTIEEGVTTADGKFTPAAALEMATNVIKKGGELLDGGGNTATQQEIKTEAAQEAAAESGGAKPAAEANEAGSNLPAVIQPQGVKSSIGSLKLPLAWIRICLIVSITCNYLHLPNGLQTALTSISISFIIATSINLIINQNKKHK